jgi:hypothetical protein
MWSKIKNWFMGTNVLLCMLFFVILSVWWISIFNRGLHEGPENNAFTLIYPLMSLIGGIMGLFISRRWGGLKSYFGSSLVFFSLGLLAQFFGQASYAYLIYIKLIAVPYPSIGDIGYFGSIFFYIIALVRLGKVIGVRKSLLSVRGEFLAFLMPAVLLIASYMFFLNGYSFDWSNPIKVILDFGYPLGQAVYVSLALNNLILSRHILGGLMKKPILFLVFTLVIQYICDFMFLYQANNGSWYVGGINDYLYFTSYFCMTIAIIYIGNIFTKIQKS